MFPPTLVHGGTCTQSTLGRPTSRRSHPDELFKRTIKDSQRGTRGIRAVQRPRHRRGSNTRPSQTEGLGVAISSP